MIPNQLKKEEFRFIKIRPNLKKPLELDWTKKNNYEFDDPKIIQYIEENKNYGVVTGFGNLLVVDCDYVDAEKLIEENLPETFTVLTGSGKKHFYYICKDGKNLKLFRNEKKEMLGDVQFDGKQVIGAGSIHPNGNEYKIFKDVPIREIKIEQIIYCFKDYLKYSYEKKKIKRGNTSETDKVCKEIKNKISIRDLLEKAGINTSKNPTECLWHSSNHGQCFSFNDETFNCFHCGESGSIFDLYMKWKNVSFIKAKKDLANYAGVEFKEEKNPAAIFTNKKLQFEEFKKIQPIFYDRAGLWWLWDNEDKYWKIVDEIDILNMIDESMNIDIINSKIRNETLNALKQYGRKQIPKEAPKSWIQFKNGIVDLNDKEIKLIEPSNKYFITNPIQTNISDCVDTPVINKIFEEWVGEKYVETLYEIISYCLYRDYPIHRIFCFIGSGLNGKSKFFKLIENFIGLKNCSTTELDTLMMSRFEITKLYKKLVCQMGETNFNEIYKTSILKKLCGNDLIGFEYKNKTPFEDRNYAKILISTNNLPTTNDKTIGFYRRWQIIDFPNLFNEDKDILEIIPCEEYENLSLKCVFILRNLLKNRRFTNEGSLEDRKKKFEDKSNPLDKFIKEFTIEDYDGLIWKWEFEKKLNEWCRENKYREMGETTIGRKMKEKGILQELKNCEWYTGNESKRIRAWIGIKWLEQVAQVEQV